MKRILLGFGILLNVLTSVAQDPVFSQFYAASMFTNPALAADKQRINFSINTKLNTSSTFGSYNLMQASAILPIEIPAFKYSRLDHVSGAGLTVYRETMGANGSAINTFGLMGTFAHSVQIKKTHYLALGLQVVYMRKSIEDAFRWGSQYDPVEGYDGSIIPSVGSMLTARNIGSVNAGIAWFMNNSEKRNYVKGGKFDAFAGFAVYNINRPNQSFFDGSTSYLPVTYKLHGGVKYSFNRMISMFPNILFVRQNWNNQVNIGAYFVQKTKRKFEVDDNVFKVIAGLWFRYGDSFIFLAGAQWHDFKIGISYDMNVSSFQYRNRGRGVTEISLKYVLPRKRHELMRGMMYPSF